jgi:hypothetical protein
MRFVGDCRLAVGGGLAQGDGGFGGGWSEEQKDLAGICASRQLPHWIEE